MSAGNQPLINVITLGHAGHGKTTLTAAITKVLAVHGRQIRSYEEIHNAPEEKARGIVMRTSRVEFDTATRRYSHIDCPDHMDYVKNMITGAAQMDGAILVADAIAGPINSDQIRLARDANIPYIIVFLNKADLADKKELVDLVEQEVRGLLKEYGYPGDEVPVIRGSAKKALEGDVKWEQKVVELAANLDGFIQVPKQPIDKPFLFPIEEVFEVDGRETVVTGRFEQGSVEAGDEVEIVGIRATIKTVVLSVEKVRKVSATGRGDENVRIHLRDVKPEKVERGQVLAKPNSITAHTKFAAVVYVLSNEEGGRHLPFFAGYSPQFAFRLTDVTGIVELPAGVERANPGEKMSLTIFLISPMPMVKGMKFTMIEGGRTIAVGIVTKIIS